MDPVHKNVVELMPWYVNGTLTGHDRAVIESHVRECLPCRAALREEQRLPGMIRAQDDVPLSAGHGMSDLLRKIDGDDARATPLWQRPRFGLGIAGIAVAAALVLAGPMIRNADAPRAGAADGDAPFTTLTDDTGVAANRIDIVFADAVAGPEILEIIESLGARLIGGPTELGRYTVAVGAESESELAGVIDRLARDPRIRFVGRNYSASSPADPVTP
jgi:hypothetical protein